MAIKKGLDCKLYRGTAGSAATTLMKNVKDVTLNLEKGEADITTRAANGWKQTAATLKDGSLEFEMLLDPQDADYQAFNSAFYNDTPLAMFISDGEGNGVEGDFVITNFSEEEPLEEAVSIKVTMKPTNIGGSNGRAPAYKTGGATT